MKNRTNRVWGWIAVALIALASPALADQHEKKGKSAGGEPSAEERAKMADAHQKMAECLRSTRPMKECRADMKKMHGMEGCGMGHHGDAAGRSDAADHAHGSKDPAKAPSPNAPAK